MPPNGADREDLAALRQWKEDVSPRLERLEKDVDALKAFRAWILGGTAVVMWIAGYFAEGIKKLLTGGGAP